MQTKSSLSFKIKETANTNNYRILELFFKSWIDDICSNRVSYNIERNVDYQKLNSGQVYSGTWPESFKVEFDNQEDATIVKLKGIPHEFQSYIDFDNQ